MAENVYLKGTVWTEKDDDFLRTFYIQIPQRELAKRLARTRSEVQHRLEKLDLKYTDEQRMLKKQAAGYKMSEYREIVWTDEKNEYLRENYSRFLNKALAKALNVSEVAITKQAYNLRLTKSEAYLADLKANVIPKIRYSFRSRKKEVNHG